MCEEICLIKDGPVCYPNKGQKINGSSRKLAIAYDYT